MMKALIKTTLLSVGVSALLALPNSYADEIVQIKVVNKTQQDCFITIENKENHVQKIKVSPDDSTTARHIIDDEGKSDSVYCLSDFRAAGHCRHAIDREQAEGCFLMEPVIGCGIEPKFDPALNHCPTN